MKLSIVIVNYKVKYFLEQCLISLQKAVVHIPHEIFVVDNDSQDDSIEYLKPLFPDVNFIVNQKNVGFAKANNQAIKISSGEYVLLLNPDTLLGEGVIERVLEFLDSNTEAGGAGVKMIDARGRFLPESKRSIPTPWVSFCKIFGLSALFPKSNLFGRYALGFLDENKIHPIDVMAGAFMMLRKTALNKSGLLDEDFFMYGEDIDLSYRITLAGYKNYYLPEKILHYKGESTPKNSIRYVKIFYQAMDIFFKKHYSDSSFIYSICIRFAILFRAFIAGCKRIMSRVYIPAFIKKSPGKSHILIYASDQVKREISGMFSGDEKIEKLSYLSDAKYTNLKELIRKDKITSIILSDSSLTFQQMLGLMENLEKENVDFRIHTQTSNTIVSSNQI
ncbi:MAG: glycosyltransferase [Bacteroidales bacterium]